MIDVSALVVEVSADTDVISSAIAVLAALEQSQTDLSAQLAAAIASNNPTALDAAQKALDNSVIQMATNRQALAAAIAAGTSPLYPAAPLAFNAVPDPSPKVGEHAPSYPNSFPGSGTPPFQQTPFKAPGNATPASYPATPSPHGVGNVPGTGAPAIPDPSPSVGSPAPVSSNTPLVR
jgi:hypothetical protein